MQRPTIAVLLSLTCLATPAATGCGNKPPSGGSANNPAADARAQSSRPDNRQVVTEIRDIVAKVLSIEPEAVDVSAPLSKQKAAADELDVLEIVMGVEESFGVEIRDEEITGESGEISEDLSVKKLADIVSNKKSRE
jgi:acyl carrier protein